MNGKEFIDRMEDLGYSMRPNEWKPWEACLLDTVYQMAEKIKALEERDRPEADLSDLGNLIGSKIKSVIEAELRPGGLLAR